MVYQVPASKASIKQNTFEFKIPGSTKTFSVPKLKFLRPSVAIALEELSEIGAARVLFDEYLPEAFPLFQDSDQLVAFMTAWGEASGISMGESEASEPS